jgi:NAD(P)-dependent dehydrogenase (short-subunit alcohol dehydrogenase family)
MSDSSKSGYSTDLAGRVAIVTGAGQGKGEAIARALAAAGVCVAVNDVNPDRAHRVATGIRDAGGAAIDVMADVGNRFQCVNLIESTRAKWGRLDVLINCASIAPTASVLKMDEWELMRTLDVNVKGMFFMSQLVGRVMDDRNKAEGQAGGLIVNFYEAEPDDDGRAAYAATQSAIPALGRACAREFAPLGIAVHTLASPGSPEKAAAEVMSLLHESPAISGTAGQ